MNIRCPECSTEFDLPDNPEDEPPRELFCPGCGHGFEFGKKREESRNKTQLGAMGHIDAEEDAPGSPPRDREMEDDPMKTQMGSPVGRIPSPGQITDEASDGSDDGGSSTPESASPDYNPFPHAKEDVATSPGQPTPGQEEPQPEDPQEQPQTSRSPSDEADAPDANPSDPSFGAVEAGSGEATTASNSPTPDSAATADPESGDDEDDFWSSDTGDEYDAFAPETGMDPSFDEDREFFDPDAPGSRTGGSRNKKPQTDNPRDSSEGPQPGGSPRSAPSEPSSTAQSGSSSTRQSTTQPPSPGIRSSSEPETTGNTTTQNTGTERSQPSRSTEDRSWTGDDEAAIRSEPSTSPAQKIAYLALIVLLVVNGLLGWIAYKNAWMIDFVKFEQMLEVAFEGGTYEPREEWTTE